MPDVEDAKQEAVSSDGQGGEPSAPVVVSTGDLVSTTDFQVQKPDTEPEGAKKTEDTGKESGKKKPSEDEKGKLVDKESVETKPDESKKEGDEPEISDEEVEKDSKLKARTKKRIDNLLAQVEDYKTRALRAEGQIEAYSKQPVQPTKEETGDEFAAPELQFDDVMDMEDDAIRERLEENPKAFLANLANQIASETMGMARKMFTEELNERDAKAKETNLQSSVEKTYAAYSEKHADFQKMWDSGDLKRFMDDNPGHNAISAHQILIGEKRDKELQEQLKTAREEAAKEAEEKALAQYRAKRNAAVLGSGPSSTGTSHEISPELKNPKEFGGATSVLAKRLAERRQAKG